MNEKKSTVQEQSRKSRNGMQLIVASIFIFFILFLTSTVFAQDENVEPVHPMKDGLSEQINPDDNENFTIRKNCLKLFMRVTTL